MKTRIRLLLSYDGTDFCGWQRQLDHKYGSPLPSIQSTMEKALTSLFQQPIKVSASGRTDAGVHALAQVCHFDVVDKKLPQDLCWALRSHLPDSLSPKQAWIAPEDFHSTLSATHKTYRYWIWNSPRNSALLHRYSWWVRKPLDLEKLNQRAELLLGEHDFESFRSEGTPVKHSVRTLYRAHWTRKPSGLLEFRVTGNGFMKQMVRNIVGTLVDHDLKSQPIENIEKILNSRDRKVAGRAAPPQGLFLYKVYYPDELDKRCRQI